MLMPFLIWPAKPSSPVPHSCAAASASIPHNPRQGMVNSGKSGALKHLHVRLIYSGFSARPASAYCYWYDAIIKLSLLLIYLCNVPCNSSAYSGLTKISVFCLSLGQGARNPSA